MKILGISDTEIAFIYSPMVVERFADVDLVISCGDLPYYYLEYIISMLNIPLYYVRGNHASRVEFGTTTTRTSPWGGVDLHKKVVEDDSGLLLAGLEGCVTYNDGPYQYTQNQYWRSVFRLVPRLLLNKARLGRYLDIFVAHAPPWKIHAMNDPAHIGVKAFNWLMKVFQTFLHATWSYPYLPPGYYYEHICGQYPGVKCLWLPRIYRAISSQAFLGLIRGGSEI